MLGRGAACDSEVYPLQIQGWALRLLSDEQLARRVAGGDRGAFTAVYERHMPAMVRYCRGILLCREDAEDAAQTAMVAALEGLPGRPARLQLRSWLLRVAHNEAISLLRRRRPEVSLEEAERVWIADVSQTVDNRARLRDLLKDLSSLPDRQRGALVMRELCGCSYREIASALGGSEGAAMQTVFEARSAMVQFDRGREAGCDDVQRVISHGDRRALRARRIRAHMRSCQNCREFEASIKRRRGDLAILFPLGAKAGLSGLAALVGLRDRPNTVAVTSTMQRMPPGIRAAALGALVAVGGGVTTMNIRGTGAHRPGRPLASAPVVRRAGVLDRSALVRGPLRVRASAGPYRRLRPAGDKVRRRPRRPSVVEPRRVGMSSTPASALARPPAIGSPADGADTSPVPVHVRAGTLAVDAGPATATVVGDVSGVHVSARVAGAQVQVTIPAAGTGQVLSGLTSSPSAATLALSHRISF